MFIPILATKNTITEIKQNENATTISQQIENTTGLTEDETTIGKLLMNYCYELLTLKILRSVKVFTWVFIFLFK